MLWVEIAITWQISHECSELQQSINIVVKGFVSDAGNGCVSFGAAQLFLRHGFTRHCLKKQVFRKSN